MYHILSENLCPSLTFRKKQNVYNSVQFKNNLAKTFIYVPHTFDSHVPIFDYEKLIIGRMRTHNNGCSADK